MPTAVHVKHPVWSKVKACEFYHLSIFNTGEMKQMQQPCLHKLPQVSSSLEMAAKMILLL